MLKKTIQFVDYDGVPTVGTFYFNLTKAELAIMELSHEGGISKHLTRIVESGDTREIINSFTSIIDASYGIKSSDGQHFEKSPEILTKFKSSPAYSELFMELITDANAGSAFIRAVVPDNLVPRDTPLPFELPVNNDKVYESESDGLDKVIISAEEYRKLRGIDASN